MQRKKDKRILVALDLTHQSGRDHLMGLYRFADTRADWQVKLVPSTEESYHTMVERIVADGIDGAVVKGECVPELANAIRAAKVPVVSIDRPNKPERTFADVHVVNDQDRIGCDAAAFFDTLGEFASYAFVPDENDCEWSRRRGKAFAQAIARIRPATPFFEQRGGLAAFLAALPKPAAIFAAFDQRAAEALAVCRELDIKVPGGAVVLGVDDDRLICKHTSPTLTSIRPDATKQGFLAAKALCALISGREAAKEIVCPPLGISYRDSTATVSPAIHLARKIDSFLDAHALEPISVEDVVKHLGVSARLALLRYSTAKGCSIQDELVRRRIKKAKRLLARTTWPMSRIAERCGFKSQIVLAHLFKKRTGKSMRDWRSAARSPGT